MASRERQECPRILEIREEFQSLVPPLTSEEHSQLEAMLLSEGCRDALVVWQGILLDGHNRYKICREHKLDFKTVSIELDDENAAREWIIRNQLGRRNLALYQRAELAIELEDLYAAKAKERQRKGGREKVVQNSAQAGKARVELAKETGVSHETVARVKVIQEKADDETKERLRRADTTINKVYTDIKRQEDRPKPKSTPPLPKDKFNVIYADPPWCYDFCSTPDSRAIENQYSTMSLEDICQIEIPSADNAVLFLWATAPKLEEALQVLNAWGFTYRTCAVWDKEKIGMGYWFRGQHELLLVGVCGKYPCPEPSLRVSSVIRETRTKHSRKPDVVCEIIERMFPVGKYLELFSRRKRDGWTMWGLDV